MSSSSVADKVMSTLERAEVMCPICIDVLSDPVLTPCGHDFCRRCMDAHMAQHTDDPSIMCPLCRTEFEEYALNPRLKKQIASVYSTAEEEEAAAAAAATSSSQQRPPPKRRRMSTDVVVLVNGSGGGIWSDLFFSRLTRQRAHVDGDATTTARILPPGYSSSSDSSERDGNAVVDARRLEDDHHLLLPNEDDDSSSEDDPPT